MRVYLSEEFIGALVYYYAKHDMFKCDAKRIEEIKEKFVNDGNEEFGCGAISVYFSKEDAMKFCETHNNVTYNPLCDAIMISEDYDFAVMDNCKRYIKKFKKYGDWTRLKNAIKKERVLAWLYLGDALHPHFLFQKCIDKSLILL